jgi:hypothetical protein
MIEKTLAGYPRCPWQVSREFRFLLNIASLGPVVFPSVFLPTMFLHISRLSGDIATIIALKAVMIWRFDERKWLGFWRWEWKVQQVVLLLEYPRNTADCADNFLFLSS